MNSAIFLKYLEEHNELFNRIHELNADVQHAIELCSKTINNKRKIIFCGNGGSAADSQHLAAEFVGRFIKDRPALPSIALTTDTSALTCIGNDYSFSEIFSRQVSGIGIEGDCIILISTSGNSDNLIKAAIAAKSQKLKVIGLLGKGGGKLKTFCDLSIVVPSNTTARIQEAHILIGHAICAGVEINLGYSE